jgi:hypothetical protein
MRHGLREWPPSYTGCANNTPTSMHHVRLKDFCGMKATSLSLISSSTKSIKL